MDAKEVLDKPLFLPLDAAQEVMQQPLHYLNVLSYANVKFSYLSLLDSNQMEKELLL